MRKIKLLVILSVMLGVIVAYKSQTGFVAHNEIMLENIEALSANENPHKTGDCFNVGTLLCPDGNYVHYIFYNIENEHLLY